MRTPRWLLPVLLVLSSCGGAAPPPPASPTAALVEIRGTPFRTTLPNGSVLALDEQQQLLVDGEVLGTLQPDGRVEDPSGATIAALLPDGRISFGGELSSAAVRGASVTEGGTAILELVQDGSLTLRGPDGAALASVPILGGSAETRTTTLFVLAVQLMTRARLAEAEVAATLDDTVRVRVPVEGRPTRGPDSAPVTIAIFSDFQCPFCSRVIPTLETLREEYGERLRFVFIHHPLPFHDRAVDAAIAAEEAFAQRGAQGFWLMHDVLFANQRELSDADLLRYTAELGLDTLRMQRALTESAHRAQIDADDALAARIGVRGTPGFAINGRILMGAQPVEQFRAVIDDELARTERLVARGVQPSRIYELLMRSARELAPPPDPVRHVDAPRARPDPDAIYRVPVDGAPVLGAAGALVTIVVFTDFQCPFCARVQTTIARIRERYGPEVRVVLRHNPLPFHSDAMPAAEAAMEAFAQRGSEGFWAMHDVLFAHQDALGRADLERYASELRLDMRRFRRALDEHTHRAAIEADQQLARSLGASGTPSFFINGLNLRGAQPFESFQTAIDAQLAVARARLAEGTPRTRLYESLIANGATSPVTLPGDAPDAGAAADDRVYTLSVPPRAATRGAASAPVTIQIFSDFQCPFCARVRPTIEQLMTEYAGRVRLVWRHYPLPFHQRAEPAAEAAQEVLVQRGPDAFWRYHDVLFENQRALEDEDLVRYATELGGIDIARLRAALADHRHRATIQADMDAVRTAGADIGTPSFFIDGRLLQGAQPIEAFRTAIDRALRERAGAH